MASFMSSNFITLLIAVDRFVCIVVRPFAKKGLPMKLAIIGIIISVAISVTLPVMSLTIARRDIINAACILLGESISLPYSIVYIVTNIMLFVSMLPLYLVVIHKVYLSAKVSNTYDSFKAVIVKLGLIMGTNFVTSMTVVILSIVSLFIDVPDYLEAILAYVLLPLNSCVNPLVYTVLHYMKG